MTVDGQVEMESLGWALPRMSGVLVRRGVGSHGQVHPQEGPVGRWDSAVTSK